MNVVLISAKLNVTCFIGDTHKRLGLLIHNKKININISYENIPNVIFKIIINIQSFD